MKKRNKRKGNEGDIKAKWVIKAVLMAFGLSVFFSFISSILLERVSIFPSFIILLCIVVMGIMFDIVGVAVTSAKEAPFHAMAADKISGSREAVWLIRNADKVSSFCNDVVGDISGIISGAAGTTIVLKAFVEHSNNEVIASIIMAGFISTLTIGGKAAGKRAALDNSKKVVYKAALFLFILKDWLRFKDNINDAK